MKNYKEYRRMVLDDEAVERGYKGFDDMIDEYDKHDKEMQEQYPGTHIMSNRSFMQGDEIQVRILNRMAIDFLKELKN